MRQGQEGHQEGVLVAEEGEPGPQACAQGSNPAEGLALREGPGWGWQRPQCGKGTGGRERGSWWSCWGA
eukprot:3493020-Alexandrium_andersonii.AAC.1